LADTLDKLPGGVSALIVGVDWERLDLREARRLRELGFDVGAQVEPLNHSGLFGRDPIAVRIGRMTVALRKSHAKAFQVDDK
jgi:ferrous iron transport protein A